MRRLTCIGLTVLTSLLTAGTGEAQKTTKIILSGATETVDQLTLFFGDYTSPCGTYFDAATGFCCAGGGAIVFTGDPAALIARLLRSTLVFTPGISASVEGSVMTITSPIDVRVALWSTFETSACGGGTNSLLLLDGCVINNVSNGVLCDENLPHQSGLRFVGGNTTYLPQLATDPTLDDTGGDPNDGPRVCDPAEPFNVSIDCTGAGGPGLYALALSFARRSVPRNTRWGLLFLAGPPLAWTFGFHSRTIESWFVPPGMTVPNDPSLAGRTYSVQGFCGGFAAAGRLSDTLVQTIRQIRFSAWSLRPRAQGLRASRSDPRRS